MKLSPGLLRQPIAAVLIVVAAVGCAITPETHQSLVAYTTAMRQVELATDRFLLKFASVEDLRIQLEQSLAGVDVPVDDYPATFVPGQHVLTEQEGIKADIQARRDALAAISSFNDALVALAEGGSETEIESHIADFGGRANSILATLGAGSIAFESAVNLATRLLTLIQNGINKAEFEEALDLGLPIVQTIFDMLENDTTLYYEASVLMSDRARDEVKEEIRVAIRPVIELAAEHSPPTDEQLQGGVLLLQRRLALIGNRTGSKAIPTPLVFGLNKPTFDERAQSRMETPMLALESIAAKDAEVVAKQNAYYALMGAYVTSLRRTSDALRTVRSSLDNPVMIEAEANRLLDVAIGLRDSINEYKAAR